MCACLLFSLQQDVEMPIPKYFINERAKALKEREKLLGQILAKLGPQDKDGVKIFVSKYQSACDLVYLQSI